MGTDLCAGGLEVATGRDGRWVQIKTFDHPQVSPSYLGLPCGWQVLEALD